MSYMTSMTSYFPYSGNNFIDFLDKRLTFSASCMQFAKCNQFRQIGCSYTDYSNHVSVGKHTPIGL